MSTGYMPEDWKPHVRVSQSTLYMGTDREERSVRLTIGGRHISLPDGTRIEPMQADVQIEDLDALIASLQIARAWVASAPDPWEHHIVDEVD